MTHLWNTLAAAGAAAGAGSRHESPAPGGSAANATGRAGVPGRVGHPRPAAPTSVGVLRGVDLRNVQAPHWDEAADGHDGALPHVP